MELTLGQFLLAASAALLVGFSKTGIVGLGFVIVPIMAVAFGAKASVGVLVPMLVFADVFAVAWYRRHAQWGILLKLLPWVLPGVVLGSVALGTLPKELFNLLFGVLVLVMLGVKAVLDRAGERLSSRLPDAWWFSASVGVLSGFVTTVGNLAGALMSVYLLSMGLKKHGLMGTGAWYYLIVNTIKIPIHIHLDLITADTLVFNLQMTPLIVVGAFTGRYVLQRISQRWFTRAIILLATGAALVLILTWAAGSLG